IIVRGRETRLVHYPAVRNLVPLNNDVAAIRRAAMRQTGEQDVAVHEVLAVEQQVIAVKVEHRELHVHPLNDLRVANADLTIGRSVGNTITVETVSYAHEVKQAGRHVGTNVPVL